MLESFAWDAFGAVGAALWELIKSVLVPVAAAGLAAALVIWQIRRNDSVREDERRGLGVKAAAKMLLDHATQATDADQSRLSMREATFVTVEMHTYLVGKDQPVAEWAASMNGRLYAAQQARLDLVMEQVAQYGEKRITPEIAFIRDGIVNDSATAVHTLLEWQRGKIPTSWFATATQGLINR